MTFAQLHSLKTRLTALCDDYRSNRLIEIWRNSANWTGWVLLKTFWVLFKIWVVWAVFQQALSGFSGLGGLGVFFGKIAQTAQILLKKPIKNRSFLAVIFERFFKQDLSGFWAVFERSYEENWLKPTKRPGKVMWR